jgi:2-keto-4-pentenoate hydratase/2-oxohepta-3-ene-1,7-dioic acid hydratase in catechol pathway
MGPWVQTADAIADPQNVEIATAVNGDVVQKTNTSEMVFDLKTMIAFISEFTALQPGDIITTGSPSGVGAHHKPPRWLKAGDSIRFSAQGVGELANVVVDEMSTD